MKRIVETLPLRGRKDIVVEHGSGGGTIRIVKIQNPAGRLLQPG